MITYNAKFATRAWARVSNGIIGLDDVLAETLPNYVSAFENGEPPRKLIRALTQRVANIDWSWPWFEEWVIEFEKRGLWPYNWPDLEPDEDEIECYDKAELLVYRRKEIAPLIVYTANSIAYQYMHFENAHPRQQWLMSSICEAGKIIYEEYERAVGKDGLEKLPPYFPGDLTILSKVPPFLFHD